MQRTGQPNMRDEWKESDWMEIRCGLRRWRKIFTLNNKSIFSVPYTKVNVPTDAKCKVHEKEGMRPKGGG